MSRMANSRRLAATSLMKLAAMPAIPALSSRALEGLELLLGGKRPGCAPGAAGPRFRRSCASNVCERGGDRVGLARVPGQGEQRRRVAPRQLPKRFRRVQPTYLLFHRLSVATAAALPGRRRPPRESTIDPSNAAARGRGPLTPKRGLPNIGLFAAQPPEVPTKVGGREGRAGPQAKLVLQPAFASPPR